MPNHLVHRYRSNALLLFHDASLQSAAPAIDAVVLTTWWRSPYGNHTRGLFRRRKDRNARRLHRCRQMHRPGVVAEEHLRARQHSSALTRRQHSTRDSPPGPGIPRRLPRATHRRRTRSASLSPSAPSSTNACPGYSPASRASSPRQFSRPQSFDCTFVPTQTAITE